MMKETIFVLCFVFLIAEGNGQRLDLDLNPYNYFLSNPSLNDTAQHAFTLGVREFRRLGSSDLTGLITYQGKLNKLRSTVGFVNYVTALGAYQLISTGVTASHVIRVGDKSYFSLGAKVYCERVSTDYSNIDFRDDVDFSLTQVSMPARWLYDVGISFNRGDFFVAVAGLNLSDERPFFGEQRTYNFVAGYRLHYRDVIRSEHSVLLLHGDREFGYVDINNKVLIMDRLWLGLTFRALNERPRTVISSGVQLWHGTDILFLMYSDEDVKKDFNGEMMLSIKL